MLVYLDWLHPFQGFFFERLSRKKLARTIRRYEIDPIIGKENLVWAPNAVVGQHSLNALELVVNRLKAIEEMGGDFEDIVEALEDLGDIASTRWQEYRR